MIRFLPALLLFLFTACDSESNLSHDINTLIATKKMDIGVAIYDKDNEQTIVINGDRQFPMQSVYKLHISLTMLNTIDRGLFALEDSIAVTPQELLPNTWSPFRKKYPEGTIATLAELLEQTLINSDNNTSDIVMRLVGGPAIVDKYIRDIGITNTSIRNYEKELQTDWELQFKNVTTPNASIELLKQFEKMALLKKPTHQFLWQAMSNTHTGSIRDSIPDGTIVAHKTGYSGVNNDGVIAANNDIGIMELPNKNKIFFAIFITNSKETKEETYRTISEIAASIYKHYDH